MTVRDLLRACWALIVLFWDWTATPAVQQVTRTTLSATGIATNWILDLPLVYLVPLLAALGYWARWRWLRRI